MLLSLIFFCLLWPLIYTTEMMISESVTSLERIRCWFRVGLGDGFEGVRVVFLFLLGGGGYSLLEVRLGGGLGVVTTVGGGVLCHRIIPISTFAICIFTLLFPVNIRMFFAITLPTFDTFSCIYSAARPSRSVHRCYTCYTCYTCYYTPHSFFC